MMCAQNSDMLHIVCSPELFCLMTHPCVVSYVLRHPSNAVNATNFFNPTLEWMVHVEDGGGGGGGGGGEDGNSIHRERKRDKPHNDVPPPLPPAPHTG